MANNTIKGSCLCGAVGYEYSGDVRVFQYCHCSRCRKLTGSAHAANIIIAPEHFRWLKGADQVGRYEVPEAKHFATAFCRNCGSTLPWKNQTGTAVIIPAGTLDDDPGERPKQNIHYASRASWYEDASSLPKYDQYPDKQVPARK